MRSYGGGHFESHNAWPEPLASTGVWNVGALALPGTMLSFCSAAVFAMVFGFLQLGGARQELFVAEPPVGAAIGAVAAAIAWVIVVRCRRRPGRLWPRIWALTLASANSVIAILAMLFPSRSWSLTLAVAGLSASAALTPRLGKLRPDSPWVQRVAPLSLAIVLIMLPSSCAVRQVIAKKTEDRVDERIRQVRLWTSQVREVTGYQWTRLEEGPDEAAKQIDTLKGLKFDSQAVDDAELWRSAAILGKDTELAAAMQELTEAVVAGLAADRGPRVSDLKEAALRWNDRDDVWEAYGPFPRLSEIAGSYRQELGRLFGELAPDDAAPASQAVAALREHYGTQREALRAHLNETAGSWADNWVAFRVPQHAELIGRGKVSLHDVVRAPFVRSEAGTLAPGQLAQLAVLPLQKTRALAHGGAGCEAGGFQAEALAGARPSKAAPGCHCQNYEEKKREYFRLDCYSYTPRRDGTGAELRIEMRLVYGSDLPRRLNGDMRPEEIYFHFLIPDGASIDSLREEVMTALASATRELEGSRVFSTDKGGSVAGGFTVERQGRVSRVSFPKIEPLRGVTPELAALMVRVTRREG